MQEQNNTPVWNVVEGAMIAPSLDLEAVQKSMSEKGMVVELEWYPSTPNLVGLNVLAEESGLAAVMSSDAKLEPGQDLKELAKGLAKEFAAEVSLGENFSDYVPADAVFPHVEHSDIPIQVVEITAMPAVSIPFCAVVEGYDLVGVELSDTHRAVLYTSPDDRVTEGVLVSEIPVLALYCEGEDMRLIAIENNFEQAGHHERILHSWIMEKAVVYGKVLEPDVDTITMFRDHMGRSDEAERIANLVPQAEVKQVEQALMTPGVEGIRRMVEALKLPLDMVAFLRGTIPPEEVEGATLYESRGWSKAIAHSVDAILADPKAVSNNFWSAYHKIAIEKPWIIRAVASIEAALGGTLIALALKDRSKGRQWTKSKVALGAGMLVDSVWEVSLSSYLSWRGSRRSTDLDDMAHDNW